MNDLAGKHIVLGLTGGIACYKAAELCRALLKEGATVQVVMTAAAEQFITPVTMQALSGRTVYGSQWDAREPNNMPHINLSREADAILLAPCSADFMAKLLHGRADELLSLMCLARPMGSVPLLIAPAMNREMWAHPATQRNMAQITSDGATILGVGQRLSGLRRNRRRPHAGAAATAGRRDRFFPAQIAGRPAGAGDRRPDLRGHRPDSRHHQPFVRQDGFCRRPRRA